MSLPSFISQEEVLGRGAALGCSLHAGVLLAQFPGLSPRTSSWDRDWATGVFRYLVEHSGHVFEDDHEKD